MITLRDLLLMAPGLDEPALLRWIEQDWVRPAQPAARPTADTDAAAPGPLFAAIDVARVRLILELRDDLDVPEPAMPVVLSLLDQLHDARRQMRRLRDALDGRGEALRALLRPDAN